MKAEVRQLVKQLVRDNPGVEIDMTGKHVKVRSADGHVIATLPASPGDLRWRLNSRASLRQAGLHVR
jgi:hypothetical protein